MKTACLFLCAVFCLTAADLAGTWRLNIVAFGEEVSPAKLDLKVEGKKLSGTLNELTVEGTAEDDSVKFSATRPNGAVFGTLEGRLVGNELKGTAHIGQDTVEWIGRRNVLPKAAPQTRTFEPTEFHRFFSGTIPPPLHINPGDT